MRQLTKLVKIITFKRPEIVGYKNCNIVRTNQVPNLIFGSYVQTGLRKAQKNFCDHIMSATLKIYEIFD